MSGSRNFKQNSGHSGNWSSNRSGSSNHSNRSKNSSSTRSNRSSNRSNASNKKLGRQISKGVLAWQAAVAKEPEFKVEGVENFNDATIQRASGYSDEFLDILGSLRRAGIYCAVRAKPLSLQNARHDRGAFKTINDKAKSVPPTSACLGHLPIDERYTTLNVQMQNPDLAIVNFIENKDGAKKCTAYATYERQSINSIKSQVDAGHYKIIKTDPLAKFIIIEDRYIGKDKKPHYYKISFKDDELRDDPTHTDIVVSVAAKSQRFNQAANKALSNMTNGLDLSKTVRLLRCDADGGNVNLEPHITCDENGIPIKGDVDLQCMILPNDLPVICYKNLDQVVPVNALARHEKLMNQLLKLGRTLRHEHHAAMANIVEQAYKNLKALDSADAQERITNLGEIGLMYAAVVLAGNGDIQHGDEGLSPLKPENITVTQIQDSRQQRGFIVTHNEFELVKTLLLDDTLSKNNVINFNPCYFVPGTWREDLVKGEMRATYKRAKDHGCYNKFDEEKNITLWKLLFEKQLLNAKLKRRDFSDFVQVIQDNMADMLENSRQDEVLNTWHMEGKAVADAIIANVAKLTDPESINKRIKKINEQADRLQQDTPTLSQLLQHR